ncbi:hypothetical protein LSH36_65g04029 [Paralvinella palmiformis]|uniref:MARVEL domain-containing protein n=1 Tax=Paralvinella palmiformis TaxID=53620 RepID=A0AAD9K3N5_9ANNE|nr:hypothetical protein LSH36_65g04029 [Paralvinella palmiformis]
MGTTVAVKRQTSSLHGDTMDTSMPTTYDSAVTSSGSSTGLVDKEFAGSLKGIFRIIEVLVSLIAFICVAVAKGRGNNGEADWCMFVTMFSFLVLIITYFLWLFRVFTKQLGRAPIKFSEFIMFVVWDILYFIAGCVAAAFGYKSAMGAGAFFLFAMLLLCAGDTFFHYRYWQSSDEGPYICGHQVGGGSGSSATSPSAAPQTGDARTPTY